MRHVALSVSEHPHGCRIKSITHLTLPRKPVTLHSAKKISALARKIDRCRQTIVYIHTSLGLKTSFNSDKQPWTGVDAQAHPPFLNSYTDADGSFASASWEIFPSAVFFFFVPPVSHPASCYLRHIFHTLVYESKLTAGRLLFKLWKKWLWIEHVALRLLGAPRLQSFLEWCISKAEKRKIFKTKTVEK